MASSVSADCIIPFSAAHTLVPTLRANELTAGTATISSAGFTSAEFSAASFTSTTSFTSFVKVDYPADVYIGAAFNHSTNLDKAYQSYAIAYDDTSTGTIANLSSAAYVTTGTIYYTMPTTPGGYFGATHGSFVFDLALTSTATNYTSHIVNTEELVTDATNRFRISYQSGTMYAELNDANGDSIVAVATYTPTDTGFHRYECSYDTSRLSFYADGVRTYTTTTTSYVRTGSEVLTIGSDTVTQPFYIRNLRYFSVPPHLTETSYSTAIYNIDESVITSSLNLVGRVKLNVPEYTTNAAALAALGDSGYVYFNTTSNLLSISHA